MGYGLYFKENVVVGQPAPYKCLKVKCIPQILCCTNLFFKTKNTFVTVHGWGTIVFQTYPDYEEQGSNLVVEIVFRTINIVMREKGMRRLRNLYLQFDNHSINKNYALLSALGALTLLGSIRT